MIVTFYLPYGETPDEQKEYAEVVEQLKKLGVKYHAMLGVQFHTMTPPREADQSYGTLYQMSVDKGRIDAALKKVPAWLLRKLTS